MTPSVGESNCKTFLASIEKTCRVRIVQVRRYQDAAETAALAEGNAAERKHELPNDAVSHMNGVFESLQELSRYVCYEPNLTAIDYYEYRLVSQLLVLAWKSTVYLADIVAHLQHQILCSGSWLSKQPSLPLTLASCLQGYRLYCRIAEESIDFLRSGLRIQLCDRHHHESRLMLMNTKVDGERETLENWLKTLHNDMSSVINSIDPKFTLLSFQAKWE
ncbi:hypothetical protein HOP50_11g64780 [Chloropicon primus]|uniref:Uncharacterized protein n=1 Tax=Chloropicon primus TaxID=1764295 RepID=A0A5B8MWV6_9CHLO|nr:hypothetical protein A3770_11p64580 [Chloropicon primus]UPR03151.1 hypothetical protein HOP50_11g64780 [Chloropicon primus]|mmetsp:Transcript_1394/g.3998  ORF Transcript_1394/g.3998 Transcript_1394/m.3998 type:complete len:219 (-) Transcript_1394:911-1567(-)|eukprot:QDZ23940.1 hypothetical protein A3770_11p64580 [Chloropicon primus]